MPILEDFCNALKAALSEYETEVQVIPVYRQETIRGLRTRLDGCLQNQMDSAELREEMVEYTKNIPAGFFAFIPLFDSRLRKKLQAVLNDNHFSEKQLSIKERTQDRASHKTELNTLKAQIDSLSEQLEKERAKDSVQMIDKLTATVTLQQQNIDLLTTRNKELLQSLTNTAEQYQNLQTNYETLSKNYDDLQIKYNALLEEKSSANQNTKPTGYSPVFT